MAVCLVLCELKIILHSIKIINTISKRQIYLCKKLVLSLTFSAGERLWMSESDVLTLGTLMSTTVDILRFYWHLYNQLLKVNVLSILKH